MNKIKTTAGIIALGAASLQAAEYAEPAGSQQGSKPWSLSATLRGFYDDNYSTSPKQLERESVGFEISPTATLNLIRDQTAIGLNYVYSLRWYEDRSDDPALDASDQSHQFNAKLSHAFTPRYKVDVSNSFAIAQEPQLFTPASGAVAATFLRAEGDNIRNFGDINFSADLTENTAVVLGYSNEFYDYDEEGLNSRSAILDRMENLFKINLRQVVLPKTVGVVGYQYEMVDYDDEATNLIGNGGQTYRSEERNTVSHYFYLGVDQGITPTLNAALRVGAQYTKYDDLNVILRNNPGVDEDAWSPYVDANATWLYLPGSYAQIGVRHQRAQSDVGFLPDPARLGGISPNLDSESTSVYGSVNHRIFGNFVASLIGQYQNSSYENGISSSFTDDYYLAGVNLTYEINRFVSVETGYNFDKLESDLGNTAFNAQNRSFTRNRIYIGVRGTY